MPQRDVMKRIHQYLCAAGQLQFAIIHHILPTRRAPSPCHPEISWRSFQSVTLLNFVDSGSSERLKLSVVCCLDPFCTREDLTEVALNIFSVLSQLCKHPSHITHIHSISQQTVVDIKCTHMY